MTDMDPHLMTVAEAADAIGSRRLHPSELVEACLERAGKCERHVQAWAYLAEDEARTDARLLDAQSDGGPGPGGPLCGIPFGVKDIIEAAGLPCRRGTPIYRGHVSERDAASVALLKEAGGICLGKTVTTELAHFHPGKARNPHRLTHTPGGSSSGSAAAVAAGMVPVAIGTQTTGSVLRPAAFCGVFGFKPSFGDVSCSGVMACALSFDTVGWFTRALEDIETVRQALVRVPHRPLEAVALRDLRIGMFQGPYWDEATLETRDLIAGAGEALARTGAKVVPIATPLGFGDLAALHRKVSGFEFARAITFERVEHGGKLSPKLLDGRCRDGLDCSYEDYAAAQDALGQARDQTNGQIADLMASCDVLLTPVATGSAPQGLLATGNPVFNTAWTALGLPALSIPAFKDRSGLPIGMQIVGGYRRDRQMLAAAQAIARHFEVATVRPVG